MSKTKALSVTSGGTQKNNFRYLYLQNLHGVCSKAKRLDDKLKEERERAANEAMN